MNKHVLVTPDNILDNSKGITFDLQNKPEEVPMTFKDFTQIYSWPNMGSLRKLAYESETNGLKNAFIKFQKRRLVLPLTLFRLLKGEKKK